jgi:hypothetical protein
VTLEAVIGEFMKLAMASGFSVPFVLVGLLLAAVLIVGLRSIGWRMPPGDPDWNKPKPDATWGDNVKPDGGPPGGGMEGG